ncbi:hypothetical protein [Candidatus Poriferisodalis sp.]|uniref:hypothetical protein n=1 Tax=Candidatus Poriferisodalis sp. TaxID=3101277 RepID=UPI003AF918A4
MARLVRHTSGLRGSAPRDQRGEVLPFLILWPPLVVLVLILVVHAFIVTGARAEAEAAASAGLRAAWRSVGAAGLAYGQDGSEHTGSDPNPRVAEMTDAVADAVARTAAPGQGWRWWTPGAATVRSDWCHSGAASGLRPAATESGWIRVEVSGEVFGPFSALWPGRLDRVHAAAAGPAALTPPTGGNPGAELPTVPTRMPIC